MAHRSKYSSLDHTHAGEDPRNQFAHAGGLPAPWPYGLGSPGLTGFPGAFPYGVLPYVGMYGGVAGAYGPNAYGNAQWRPDYSGRGPKNYRRSDARIRDDVNERLTRDPDIDPSEVEVEVRGGVVTLRGIVEDRSEKHRIEDVIDDVFGVLDIDNGLKVRHGILATLTGEKASDSEIAAGSTGRDQSNDTRSPRRRTSVQAALR